MDKDQYLGGFTAIFGLLVMFVLIPWGIELDEVEPGTQLLIRPDFWPMVVGGLMVFLGSLYVIVARAKYKATAGGAAAAPKADQRTKVDTRRLAAIVVVVLLFAVTSDVTGMVLPAIALFVVSAFGFGGGHILYKVVGAILVPLVILQFFERVADIPIPLGILENILT